MSVATVKLTVTTWNLIFNETSNSLYSDCSIFAGMQFFCSENFQGICPFCNPQRNRQKIRMQNNR